jgi:hypothetical protein
MKRTALGAAVLATVLAGAGAATALGGTSQSSDSVSIRLAGTPPNFSFRGVPETLEAGRTTFRFRNTSPDGVAHNFRVVRTLGGGRRFNSRTLQAGQSQTKSVRLTRGTYIALCTIGNGFHAQNGMLVAFTVE